MSGEYKVLARKYRPDNLFDLKGQELLVRALTNAIKYDRIAHAFLLSGIRGIGKTTSARIIAKTINCTDIKFKDEIAVTCNHCTNCMAFASEKHPDLLEIDAASKTGVNDMRDIIDSAIYRPIMGKYKIYIIDEVHMLSTSAFNALLKTLEEPPLHVKFIFATTELRKIPLTILSRCQKFDLKRLSEEKMLSHLQQICANESVTICEEGLVQISKLSEGSVRDALSLTDLVINSSGGESTINFDIVKGALGLAGRDEILKLLSYLMVANIGEMLKQFKNLYFAGISPTYLIEELLTIINDLTKFRLTGEKLFLSSQDQSYYSFIAEFTNKIDNPRLLYLWQILFKGLKELAYAANQYSCCEMVLIKACLISGASDDASISLDTKDKKAVDNSEQTSLEADTNNIKESSASNDDAEKIHSEYSGDRLAESSLTLELQPEINSEAPIIITQNVDCNILDVDQIQEFKSFVEIFRVNHELILHHHLVRDVHLVSIKAGELIFKQNRGVPHNLANQISKVAKDLTNIDWRVRIVAQGGFPTIEEIDQAPEKTFQQQAIQDALVQNVLNNFEGSKIKEIHCEALKN